MLTHWIVLTGTPRSSASVCSAMLTTVLSKMTASPPVMSTRAVTMAWRVLGVSITPCGRSHEVVRHYMELRRRLD